MTDTITVTINGRAVVFERSFWPHEEVKCYRNGDVMLISNDWDGWTIYAGDKAYGDHFCDAQTAVDCMTDEANSWAPVLRELERLGNKT
jgi:hypothetical protein